jgi:hypothetical protein
VSRYLTAALITEGESDEEFLRPVLQRHLDERGLAGDFVVGDILTAPVRSVRDPGRVDEVAKLLLGECDLLLVHHDDRERSKIDALRARIGAGKPIVAVVPVKETEAWVLAAACTARPPGFNCTDVPPDVCWVERVADPKAELRRRYARTRRDPRDDFARLGTDVDLALLGRLGAYRDFHAELDVALKELHLL